jgi:hypothetical protein
VSQEPQSSDVCNGPDAAEKMFFLFLIWFCVLVVFCGHEMIQQPSSHKEVERKGRSEEKSKVLW